MHTLPIEFTVENRERAQLIRIRFGELMPVQQIAIGCIDQRNLLIEIYLRVEAALRAVSL